MTGRKDAGELAVNGAAVFFLILFSPLVAFVGVFWCLCWCIGKLADMLEVPL